MSTPRTPRETRPAGIDPVRGGAPAGLEPLAVLPVFVPLHGKRAVLARELVYTGITRASREFTLLTPAPAVLGEAIARRTHRASGLRGMIER